MDDERSALVSLNAATTDPQVRYVFGGHVHHQTLYYKSCGRGQMVFQSTAGIPIPLPGNRQWIATVGSVGQPRDRKPLAMYALFDLAQSRLTFHRVADDHVAAATAAAVRRAGLPEYFAKRLEKGKWWRSAARLWSLLPRALLRPAGRRIEKNSGPARLDCT